MPEPFYMLDTNTVSFLIKGNEKIKNKINQVPMSQVCISSITEAELRRGVAKKPEARRLAALVNELLIRVDTLPWDSDAAISYANIRTASEKMGISLSTMDVLIAAHACAVEAILITNDKAFRKFEDFLMVHDWLK